MEQRKLLGWRREISLISEKFYGDCVTKLDSLEIVPSSHTCEEVKEWNKTRKNRSEPGVPTRTLKDLTKTSLLFSTLFVESTVSVYVKP